MREIDSPPVRFDERRLEPEPRRGVRHRHWRKPPGTATPSAYRHRASRRLYPPPANNPRFGQRLIDICGFNNATGRGVRLRVSQRSVRQVPDWHNGTDRLAPSKLGAIPRVRRPTPDPHPTSDPPPTLPRPRRCSPARRLWTPPLLWTQTTGPTGVCKTAQTRFRTATTAIILFFFMKILTNRATRAVRRPVLWTRPSTIRPSTPPNAPLARGNS